MVNNIFGTDKIRDYYGIWRFSQRKTEKIS